MTYFFLLFIVVLLAILNLVILRNKSLVQKILISGGVLAGGVLLFMGTLAILWNMSTDPRERRFEEELKYKHIYLTNNKMKGLRGIVSYTYKNAEGHHGVRDTLQLDYGNTNSNEIRMEIAADDHSHFPEDFKLVVIDSLYNKLAEYDKALFFKKCTTGPAGLEKLDARVWHLDLNTVQ